MLKETFTAEQDQLRAESAWINSDGEGRDFKWMSAERVRRRADWAEWSNGKKISSSKTYDQSLSTLALNGRKMPFLV